MRGGAQFVLMTGARAALLGMRRASTGPHAIVMSEFALLGQWLFEEFQEVERIAGYQDLGGGLSHYGQVPLYVVLGECHVIEE